jgi:hypothetical protein
MQHQLKKPKHVGHAYVGVVDGVAVMMEVVEEAAAIVIIMELRRIMIVNIYLDNKKSTLKINYHSCEESDYSLNVHHFNQDR